MKKEKPNVVFVRLPKEMDTELDKFAKSQGNRSKSSVVRQAIKEFLSRLT